MEAKDRKFAIVHKDFSFTTENENMIEQYKKHPEFFVLEYNKKILQRMGLITEHTSSAEVNAMLAAAHLGGAGSVKALKEGKNRRDAYGTPVSEYYQMGLRAT